MNIIELSQTCLALVCQLLAVFPMKYFRQSFLYFNDICIGWPGRVHDARVLANSRLFVVAERAGTAFPGSETVFCDGARIPVLILGYPAYPL